MILVSKINHGKIRVERGNWRREETAYSSLMLM